MKKDTIVIGTRSSKLALWQADYVEAKLREKYPELHVVQKRMTTKGDRVLDAPLAKIGGKGLFTKELEQSMLAGEIDLAVHSLKDMPTELPEGLVLAAVTERFDPGDAVVSPRYQTLANLPQGAKVGTSSLRRRAQLLAKRPDLEIVSLRGNVNTRLKKLEEENFDAIILAVAGLKRLGFHDRITEVLSREICLPAVGQGALAIEARADDEATLSLIAFLDAAATRAAARAERAFLARVEGGCQVPVGVYAEAADEALEMEAVIASIDGERLYRKKKAGSALDAEKIGRALAEELLAMGGKEILQELGLLQP